MTRRSEHPKREMFYDVARKKALRIAKNDKITDKKVQARLVNSLVEQVRLHDGVDAVKEVQKEILMDTNNHSKNKLGWGRRYAKRHKEIFKK